MLTEITTAPSVQTASTVPASPAEIHPNTSIADLNAIKVAWT